MLTQQNNNKKIFLIKIYLHHILGAMIKVSIEKIIVNTKDLLIFPFCMQSVISRETY